MNDISKIISLIQQQAAVKSASDSEDFDPADQSCNNFNYCFDLGVEEGKAIFARQLLVLLAS